MPHNIDPQRVLAICNACRYCEGYCAVFPAMERRTVFSTSDVAYLANLCHNCGECYYACPYTPPHEFAVNVPKLLAELRARSYRECARPHYYGAGMLGAVGFVAFLAAVPRTAAGAAGDFYRVVSHSAMVGIFGAAAAFVAIALGASLARFARASGAPMSWNACVRALRDAASLRYLSGGDGSSSARRWFHHFTSYGFLLCLASTITAAADHYFLGLRAPYPFWSMPVLLGTTGGVGLLIGPAGLLFLKSQRDPVLTDPHQDHADLSFLAMLLLVSSTGLLLLMLRESAAMGVLLRVHLATVLALFLAMPYGKFVHGFYRFAALVRYAREAASSAPRKAR